MRVTAPYTDEFTYEGKTYTRGQVMNLPVDVIEHHRVTAGIAFLPADDDATLPGNLGGSAQVQPATNPSGDSDAPESAGRKRG